MNGNTKSVIKKQLINWLGIAIVCFVSFYFTANATLKQHGKEIEKYSDCLDRKLDTELFDVYIGGINRLIDSNYELIKKDVNYNKEQIELLRDENKEIRNDVKLIVKQIDFKTRSKVTSDANIQ